MHTTMATNPADQAQCAEHFCLTILVVEDNPDSQQLVCELLGALGHRAVGVGSGEQALAELETQTFNIMLTDVNLPGMSGIELARQTSRKQPSLKIVFASGYGAQIGKNFGAGTMVLPKPYDIDQLQHILSLIMREQQGG